MTITPEWSTAIDDYLAAQRAAGYPPTTLYTRRQHLQHLARRAHTGPWQLTGDDLTGYAAAQNWERETRRGRRVTFVSFWSWATTTGRTSTDPTATLPRVKATDPNPRPVPDRVYLEALMRADHDERLWIDLAAEHGLRRAEIARIHSRDITPTLLGYDLDVHGKGGRRRLVPLTPTMARELLAKGDGYVFPGDEDGHVSARWLGKRVGRLLDGAWTIHKLRHRAAARFWAISGGDPYLVASLMGWANLNMVPVYVPKPTDRLRAVVLGASRAHSPVRQTANLASSI